MGSTHTTTAESTPSSHREEGAETSHTAPHARPLGFLVVVVMVVRRLGNREIVIKNAGVVRHECSVVADLALIGIGNKKKVTLPPTLY